jgi:hypothetical protein
MSKLLNESKYEVNFKESPFINQGSLWGRIYRYITFYRSSAKGYTDREGLHTKSGKVESLISCMIIAANKSSKEVIDDEEEAFYEERFPIVRS